MDTDLKEDIEKFLTGKLSRKYVMKKHNLNCNTMSRRTNTLIQEKKMDYLSDSRTRIFLIKGDLLKYHQGEMTLQQVCNKHDITLYEANKLYDDVVNIFVKLKKYVEPTDYGYNMSFPERLDIVMKLNGLR